MGKLTLLPQESKLWYSEKVISETKSSLQSFIKYWFWSFYHPSIHDIQLLALFTQFGDDDAMKERNIPEFWKIKSRTGFDLIKMQMAASWEDSIVAWLQYITLKLFWRPLEDDTI